MKKRNKILVIILVFLLLSILVGCNTQNKKGKDIECSVEIVCDNLNDNREELKPELVKLLPKNGVVLEKTKIKTTDQTSVLEVTDIVCRENKISFVYKGSIDGSTGYVEGIAGIFEKDAGKTSGWMYKVNDKMPKESGGTFKCFEGCKIKWYYVRNYNDK